jgi:hypothetical protein
VTGVLRGREAVKYRRIPPWKVGKDPQYEVKKARIEHLYAIADREVTPDDGEPAVIFCVDLCRSRNYAEAPVA